MQLWNGQRKYEFETFFWESKLLFDFHEWRNIIWRFSFEYDPSQVTRKSLHTLNSYKNISFRDNYIIDKFFAEYCGLLIDLNTNENLMPFQVWIDLYMFLYGRKLWSLTNFYVSLKLLQAKSRFLCDINGRKLPKERYKKTLT